LHLGHDRYAALTAHLEDGRSLTDRQLRLFAGLAHQSKLAIESAEHYRGLERTFLSTVASLANALEANDAYTSSHARWITDMALLVGRRLGLERDTLKRLELAALFHDIGKIGIPSEILKKPGPLTDEERVIVESHPELGERILAPIDRLADVKQIVRACHERWDGLGYPDGRAGEEIPVEARIVLVCDAFHAMVTDRPYRAALAVDEALGRLRESAGTQFDPIVVDAFAELCLAGELPPLER
jgi:HD-GYP domain-containing protein (c-di-GMP phosphodiesterase class II)